MVRQAQIAASPNLTGQVRVDFWTPDFDALVWNKGYNVLWEQAIGCPCSMRIQQPKSSCRNCMGSGWIFINPVETKAVIQSINKDTKFKEWSQEMLGTCNMTIENRFQVNFMDRITILDSIAIDSEVHVSKEYEDKSLYFFATYPIKESLGLFQFIDSNTPLKYLELGQDYEIDDYKVILNNERFTKDQSFSLRYKHNLIYHVIDIPHNIRNSYFLNEKSREVQNLLPVSAIIRKAHYVIDKPDFNGGSVFDNSNIIPKPLC